MKNTNNKIAYLTDKAFKLGLMAAAARLIEHYEHLNDINVFPVADGDTGSNMASTMRAIVEGIKKNMDASLDSLGQIISESALIGARGNSGIILAQFFHGLTEGIKGAIKVGPKEFAQAAILAKENAYKSLSNPQEGTILTVIGDWAEHIWKHAHLYNDFEELMQDSLAKAKQSLTQTTDKLKSLQKAGVVDAGAQGFVYLLDGVVDLIKTGRVKSRILKKNWSWSKKKIQGDQKTHLKEHKGHLSTKEHLATGTQEKANIQAQDLLYRFCTEALLTGNDLDQVQIRQALSGLGDSLIAAGSNRTLRVHIHTNEPEKIFAVLQDFGALAEKKVEDMEIQHRHVLIKNKVQVGIVTDSTCDLPSNLLKKFDIHFAPLSLFLDEEEFIDKVEMGAEEFTKRLPQAKTFKTSQPAPIRFKETFAHCLTEYKELISIHLSGGLSGTYLGALQMSKLFTNNISIVDSKTLSAGLGLITLEAAQAAQKGLSREQILEKVAECCHKIRFFVALDTLDYAVKGGRVSRGMGLLAKLLRIKPIISFDNQEGKAHKIAQAVGRKQVLQKMITLLKNELNGVQQPKFAIAHVQALEQAHLYAEAIEKHFGVKPLYITPASPVLGIYSGLGAVGVAMLCP